LVDEHGIPLSIVVTGANRHDVTQVAAVLDGKVMEPGPGVEQHLCADKGYKGKPAKKEIEERGYIAHVVSRHQEAVLIKDNADYKPRRWVVEVCHSWFHRFRKLLVRYEKKLETYEALLHLAAAIICLRKVGFIYG
jgi:putative transposase